MESLVSFLALQYDGSSDAASAAAGGIGIGMVLCWLVVVILSIAGLWKTFEKAGQPGWAAIIPIYNLVVLLQIAGRPIWWLVLMLIPVVNLIIAILVSIDVARAFGKGTGFGIGLALLGFIFYPILGFGDARYQGASVRPA